MVAFERVASRTSSARPVRSHGAARGEREPARAPGAAQDREQETHRARRWGGRFGRADGREPRRSIRDAFEAVHVDRRRRRPRRARDVFARPPERAAREPPGGTTRRRRRRDRWNVSRVRRFDGAPRPRAAVGSESSSPATSPARAHHDEPAPATVAILRSLVPLDAPGKEHVPFADVKKVDGAVELVTTRPNLRSSRPGVVERPPSGIFTGSEKQSESSTRAAAGTSMPRRRWRRTKAASDSHATHAPRCATASGAPFCFSATAPGCRASRGDVPYAMTATAPWSSPKPKPPTWGSRAWSRKRCSARSQWHARMRRTGSSSW